MSQGTFFIFSPDFKCHLNAESPRPVFLIKIFPWLSWLVCLIQLVGFSFRTASPLNASSLCPILTTPKSPSRQTVMHPPAGSATSSHSCLLPLLSFRQPADPCLYLSITSRFWHFPMHKHPPVNPPPLQVQVIWTKPFLAWKPSCCSFHMAARMILLNSK